MDPGINTEQSADKTSKYLHLSMKLPPANYLDKLYLELSGELLKFASPEEITLIDKLCHLIQHDYERQGLIGNGYHCLEHSLEVAILTLKAADHPGFYMTLTPEKECSISHLAPSELLELAVASLLHDYDPHASGDPPRVERTLFVLKTDDVLKDFIERLNLKTTKIALLIERTDYPFTPQKEIVWEGELLFYFNDKLERDRFRQKAERVALMDKGSAYFSLYPDKARKRVEDLSLEIKVPKETLLAGTAGFLEKEKVRDIAGWLPEKYVRRWLAVERYFRSIPKTIFQPRFK